MLSIKAAVFIAAAVFPLAAFAQTPSTVTSPSELTEKLKDLRAKAASGDGSASVKLAEYPNHFTMLALRTRTGSAEQHARFADIFFVLHGHARLVTGGVLADQKAGDPEELRGASVHGGTEQAVGPGDIIHIPAGVAHQLLIPDNEEFAYYVVKAKEK